MSTMTIQQVVDQLLEVALDLEAGTEAPCSIYFAPKGERYRIVSIDGPAFEDDPEQASIEYDFGDI